jgi:hypothetical protein
MKEDAPTNSAGSGSVDGIGVGDKGEPPGKKKRFKDLPLRRKNVLESTVSPIRNLDSDLAEDAKMAKVSDANLKSRMKQQRDLLKTRGDSPSTQFMIKRIGKEMKKRGLKEGLTAGQNRDRQPEANKVRRIDDKKTVNKTYEEKDRFAGSVIFDVDEDTFVKSRMGRNRYERWARFVDLDSNIGQEVREYHNKYPSEPIILRNNTGAMFYLKQSKKE